jgi:hypothetical protein
MVFYKNSKNQVFGFEEKQISDSVNIEKDFIEITEAEAIELTTPKPLPEKKNKPPKPQEALEEMRALMRRVEELQKQSGA